jgi:hypothetical protein
MRRAALLFLVAALSAVGCGRSTVDPLAPVRGRVTVRGMPLPGGLVVFAPDSERGTAGPLAIAVVAADGTFTLASEGNRGAVPGWHRVTVSAAEPRWVPPRYRQPDTSGLRAEVHPGRENVIDLDVAGP